MIQNNTLIFTILVFIFLFFQVFKHMTYNIVPEQYLSAMISFTDQWAQTGSYEECSQKHITHNNCFLNKKKERKK